MSYPGQPPGEPPSNPPGGQPPPPPGWQTPPQPPAAPPPPTAGWQSTPQPPTPPPPAGGAGWQGGGSGWTSNLTSRQAAVGPNGTAIGDLPSRIGAYIIDAIILAIVTFIVGALLGAVISPITFDASRGVFGFGVNPLYYILYAIIATAIGAAYFIFLWTSRRQTVGMMVVGLQVGNETDGGAISMNQAVLRWALLGGPLTLTSALYGFGTIGLLIALLGLVWFIALVVTTAQSPTYQGLHDRQAKTIVLRGGQRMMG